MNESDIAAIVAVLVGLGFVVATVLCFVYETHVPMMLYGGLVMPTWMWSSWGQTYKSEWRKARGMDE